MNVTVCSVAMAQILFFEMRGFFLTQDFSLIGKFDGHKIYDACGVYKIKLDLISLNGFSNYIDWS